MSWLDFFIKLSVSVISTGGFSVFELNVAFKFSKIFKTSLIFMINYKN